MWVVSQVELVGVLPHVVPPHLLRNIPYPLQALLPSQPSKNALNDPTAQFILLPNAHVAYDGLAVQLPPLKDIPCKSDNPLQEAGQLYRFCVGSGHILSNRFSTASGAQIGFLAVVRERAVRRMARQKAMWFWRKLDRWVSFMGYSVWLKIRQRSLPTSYRSARDCCLAREKLSLLLAAALPISERANSEAGPQRATNSRRQGRSWSGAPKARDTVGCGEYSKGPASSSSSCMQQLKDGQRWFVVHKIIISVYPMSSSILFPTNEYATSSKSSEEIQKLLVPLFPTEEETLAYILAKGLPSQMPYLYRNLRKASRVTLPSVCARAPSEDPQNQILIALSLRELIETNPPLSESELETIFQSCLECLNNLHSPANEQMGGVVEAAIRAHADSGKLVRRLEEVAVELGRPAQPIISKVTSARLISILAKYLGRMVKGEMIDVLKRVVGDSEVEAKKVWVQEIFPRLLANLDLEFIELHLQEKIYELVWGENEEIGVLALEVILKNATRFSLEEQSSRIVKLFVDSLTSKKEKIALVATHLMGQAYQKLLHVVLRSEHLSVRFWKSLIQLSQSKNEQLLHNLAYNLPGLLLLSAPLYKVQPLCDVYLQLFYHPPSDKLLLISYFHEMVRLFPSKGGDLRDVLYWMFSELFEDEDPCEEAVRILSKFLQHLPHCKSIFWTDCTEEKNDTPEQRYFDPTLTDYLMRYLALLQGKKNSNWLAVFYAAVAQCTEGFSPEFLEGALLPKLYACLRAKTVCVELVVETVVKLVARDSNPALINAYASKINVQLSKSSRSYERETALLFFYQATHYFSIDLFQQYRLGEKYLSFNNDKSFKVKTTFIRHLPRLLYFLTREEKIEHAIILTRLMKDPDPEIQLLINNIHFSEDETSRTEIVERSRQLKEKEKERMNFLSLRKQVNQNRRSSKEIKKEDVLKKRIETTKSKTKMLIKELPKKKVAPVLVKTTSNLNFRKNS